MEDYIANDMLNIAELIPIDKGIVSYECQEYETSNPLELSSSRDMHIDV